MTLQFNWMHRDQEDLHYDACEVDIETETEIIHLTPTVGLVCGFEERWVYSIDVPDTLNTGKGRALIPPAFAASYEEAIAGAEFAVRKLAEVL